MAKQRRKLSATAAPRSVEYANTPEELAAAIEARQAADQEPEQDEPAPSKATTEKATFTLPTELLAELRAMAVELPPKAFPSISGFAAEAIREAVEKARRDHNQGQPFESEERPKVRTGRPPGK